MKNLHHPNIAIMRAFWKDNQNCHLLFDYAVNGDLSKFLQKHAPLDVETTRFFLAHIINGLEYLRSRNMMHRDLKPANIVLNESWIPKLADFGTAKTISPKLISQPFSSAPRRIESSTSEENTSYLSTFSASNISAISAASVDNTSAISSDGIMF